MNRRSSKLVATSLVSTLAAGTGCTHWGANEVYQPQQEVGRVLLGAPQVAETSSSSLEAGFAGGSVTRGPTSFTSGALSGSNSSIKRTHCVQAADIDYVQPFDVTYEAEGRWLDVSSGLALAAAGVGVLLAGNIASEPFGSPGEFGYEPGADATPFNVGGGLLIAGGVGWIIGSFAALPSGPQPAPEHKERRWRSREFVEATGCGLVPGDVGPNFGPPPGPTPMPMPTPQPGGDTTADRLKRLEELHRSGLITDAEYQAKRKEILGDL